MDRNFRNIFFLGISLFVAIGAYNTVVISASEGFPKMEQSSVRRLDEMAGVVIPGRDPALKVNWKKISRKNIENVSAVQTPVSSPEIYPEQHPVSLYLVEVSHPNRWQQGLSSEDFFGELVTTNEVIEELEVNLPDGSGLSVAFSELNGNVFEYEFRGEIYSGLLYQVDQASYIVNLTNGPLEGTKLRFSERDTMITQLDTEKHLADKEIILGTFGLELHSQEIIANGSDIEPHTDFISQSFNLNQEAQL